MKRRRWTKIGALCLAAMTTLTVSSCTSREIVDNTDTLIEVQNEMLTQNLDAFAKKSAPLVMEYAAEENVLYSPVSLYLALSMSYECADGETRQEHAAILQPVSEMEQAEYMSALMEKLAFSDEGNYLKTDNALFLKKPRSLDKDVKRILKSYYRADILAMNNYQSWVKKRLKQVAPVLPDERTEVLMVNTVSYACSWKEPFTTDPVEGPFYLASGEEVTAQYLKKHIEGTSFVQTDDFSAARLFLEQGNIISFILPNTGLTPADLLSSPSLLDQALDFSDSNPACFQGEVIYKMPKTTFQSSLSLEKPMQQMGLDAAFFGGFSALTGGKEDQMIAEILQNGYFALDEKGITAEVLTQIANCAADDTEEQKILNLELDRPFLFVITDRDGRMLFIGMVGNPVE